MKECPYKYLSGKPREGVHTVRIPILDWAFVDTSVTALFAWFLAKHLKQPFWFVLLVTFLIAEISHAYFCVDSAIMDQIKKIRLIIRNELRGLY
jgi:succinate dehydrogenase hydrophobic anchor subunit